MDEIKRFGFVGYHDGEPVIEEQDSGVWVRYADHLEEIMRLRKEHIDFVNKIDAIAKAGIAWNKKALV